MPQLWFRPIVSHIVLPAHAKTSTTLSLNAIEDVIIIGVAPQTDPRVVITARSDSMSPSFFIRVDVISGTGLNDETRFTIVDNPTDNTANGRIGTLVVGDDLLLWSMTISRLGPQFLDRFPVGESFVITVKAENPNGEQADVSFNIRFSN